MPSLQPSKNQPTKIQVPQGPKCITFSMTLSDHAQREIENAVAFKTPQSPRYIPPKSHNHPTHTAICHVLNSPITLSAHAQRKQLGKKKKALARGSLFFIKQKLSNPEGPKTFGRSSALDVQ